jgi:hypothetical protein
MLYFVRHLEDSETRSFIKTVGGYSKAEFESIEEHYKNYRKLLDTVCVKNVEPLADDDIYDCPICKNRLSHCEVLMGEEQSFTQNFYHCKSCHLLEKEFESEMLAN